MTKVMPNFRVVYHSQFKEPLKIKLMYTQPITLGMETMDSCLALVRTHQHGIAR